MSRKPTIDPVEVALTALEQKRAKIAAEDAEIAADIAAFQRLRERGLLPGMTPADKSQAAAISAATNSTIVTSAPTVVPNLNSIYHGLGIAEAGVKRLSLCDRRPQKTKEILKALNDAGFRLISKNPEGALNWALRRRENKVGDVVLMGNATWGLAEWFTEAQIAMFRAARTTASTRDHDEHVERTKAGMEFARQHRGVKFGRERKVFPEEFAECLNRLKQGCSVDQAVEGARFSKSAFNHYRFTCDVENWKPEDGWPPPKKVKVAPEKKRERLRLVK
jgi:hypothetical protein